VRRADYGVRRASGNWEAVEHAQSSARSSDGAKGLREAQPQSRARARDVRRACGRAVCLRVSGGGSGSGNWVARKSEARVARCSGRAEPLKGNENESTPRQ
jgi:hypothetical protein